MATSIRILPEQLTNKIAAGEVVERPASVVKELLENSLDAGAREITVELETGGKRLIRVLDDGCGMCRDDALLALERHATSKISDDADLFALSTLGFRGEALPSIASVSRCTLSSRQRGSLEGVEIYAEGGRIRQVQACGMADGTHVVVRNLFFNTPARLKFLKSVETEAGHVADLVTRLALSRPHVRFTLISDGKVLIRALASDLRERIASLMGRNLVADLYPIDFKGEGLTLSGLVGAPSCNRSAASHLHTFVNGRYVRDRVVQHAVLQAYRSVLERGRYPVAVLFIDVPLQDVDVNVHPTKHEVRFRQQSLVHEGIQSALQRVLAASPWLKHRESPLLSVQPYADAAAGRIQQVCEVVQTYQPEVSGHRPAEQVSPLELTAAARGYQNDGGEDEIKHGGDVSEPIESGYFSSLTVIGQFQAEYIVCQDGNNLVLIDQHAAHERVAYAELRSGYAAGAVESQGLLFPEQLECSHREAVTLAGHREELTRVGFRLEEFGGTTWLLTSVPRSLASTDHLRIIRDILEELMSLGTSRTFADALDEILVRIACHSVIRGPRVLSRTEITALFARMDSTDFAAYCPHGRPVQKSISLHDIEKMFRRV